MKFLFDENLSPRLVGEVATHWPDSTHVEAVGLRGAGDEIILGRNAGLKVAAGCDRPPSRKTSSVPSGLGVKNHC